MTFPVTSLYAAVFTIILIVLANIVSAKRGKAGISIFHGDNLDLALAIRRHGNFTENVPFALLLMLLSEAAGLSALWLHAAGIALVVARIAHVVGLKADNSAQPLKIAGGVTTQLAMLGMAGYLVMVLVN